MTINIPKTMMAWRKHEGKTEPVLEEVPVPDTPVDGVLCKVLAAGVCHSDQYLLELGKEDQASWFQDKWTMGHEGSGEIVKIGPEVPESANLKVGDIVALHAVPGCRKDDCDECSRDLSQICENAHHSGIGQDGFYAPWAAINWRGCIPVPEGVSPAAASIATDAGTTAYHAITRRAEVQPSDLCVMFGLGGLGFNALQIVRHIGARVIVCDIRQSRLDAARELGVPEEDIIPLGKSPVEFVREKGLQIDKTLDFAGTHQTWEWAQEIIRRGGKLLCVGMHDLQNTVHMKIGTRKRLTFIFTYGGQGKDVAAVMDLMAKGAIKPEVSEGKFMDFPKVLKDLCDNKVEGRIALMHEH